jgi:hypothetical protein
VSRDSYYLCTIIKLACNINLALLPVNFSKTCLPGGHAGFSPDRSSGEKNTVCVGLRLIYYSLRFSKASSFLLGFQVSGVRCQQPSGSSGCRAGLCARRAEVGTRIRRELRRARQRPTLLLNFLTLESALILKPPTWCRVSGLRILTPDTRHLKPYNIAHRAK